MSSNPEATLLPASMRDRGLGADDVLQAARRCQGQMTRLLESLVRLESPSLQPETQAPVFELLSDALLESGLRGHRWRGRTSGGVLLARPRPGPAPWQLLMGHCDTVWPVGTLAEMPVVVEDGRLRGPGAYDMKCGLVQGITALRVLRQLDLRPEVTPVMLINSDEEIGSQESERFIRRLASVADRTYVLEPSLNPGGRLKTGRKGVAQYRLSVKGRAAHAGLNPDEGVSAILELSYLVQQLFDLNDAERGVSVNVGTIDGGLRPNVIAPESSAVVDVRTPTLEDAERIDTAIRSLRPTRPDVQVIVHGEEGRPPMEPTPAGRKLWGAARDLAGELTMPLQEGTAGGGSDGNLTNLLSPTLDGLGAVGDGAHALHEFVELDAMAERTALLALLLLLPPVSHLPEGPP